jgi:uncharacterized protein
MLEEKILNHYKQAMKDKDALKSSVLSFLRAELLNTAIAGKKKALDDNEIIAVIRKQAKQRQDSIEQFTKGGRADLADKETKEMEILKSYLPKEIPAGQIQGIIEEAVASTGAGGIKDMGKVMKEVLAKVGAQADSKIVSEMVRLRLAKSPS